MSQTKLVNSELPQRLRSMVRASIDVYGEAVRATFGSAVLDEIESYRSELKELRLFDDQAKHKHLKQLKHKFGDYDSAKLMMIARIFSLYMEIVNRCESAYRHVRLKESSVDLPAQTNHGEVIYVFTAHPTEARSENALFLFHEVELILKRICQEGSHLEGRLLERLQHLFCLLLRCSLSKTRKPSVKDEAEQIFSTILNKRALDGHLELIESGWNVRYRAWVGGDKDGHPFVNSETMVQSWSISREKLLSYLNAQLQKLTLLLRHTDTASEKPLKGLVAKFSKQLKSLKEVKSGDGLRVEKVKLNLSKLALVYQDLFHIKSPQLSLMEKVFEAYPALVIPLEIREDAELVKKALDHPREIIAAMLRRLSATSRGGCPKSYVQGFVLSMTQQAQDVRAGIKLMKKYLGGLEIPVIPLFETKAALENAQSIVAGVLKAEVAYVKAVQKKWQGKYEVMLGYSDSSKENGVLLSRILISKTLAELDSEIGRFGLCPLYFHGSGGSLERGGGSIREQASWWPHSALVNFKSTIQGEMISRNFADPEIMKSSTLKFFEEAENKSRADVVVDPLLLTLGRFTARAYQDLVFDEKFVQLVKCATPYSFLDQLKIGSRPSARQKSSKSFKMRAIPWVLCWTQTRVLFPVWWGLGSFWGQAKASEKKAYRELYQHSNLFQSYLKILGFTLSKVEMGVFQLYLSSQLAEPLASDYLKRFQDEYEKVLLFYRDITQESDLLWHKKWLSTSIRYRSPMIHPLNVIQLLSIERKNMSLLREATTGIACGMMTTG